jgi:drug/metabolite transporter (DMT)-like permease
MVNDETPTSKMFGREVMNSRAVFYALASAVLFGISTPAAKVLLGSMHPAALAGLLYCGAGAGVLLLRLFPWAALPKTAPEAGLNRSELPWLAGAILAGGVVGPVLLLMGLAQTSVSTASLLLTFEVLATSLMAWFIFHECFDPLLCLR